MSGPLRGKKVLFLCSTISQPMSSSLERMGLDIITAGFTDYASNIASDHLRIQYGGKGIQELIGFLASKKFVPDIVLANNEAYIEMQTVIAKEYQLPAIDSQHAAAVVKKDVMRQTLSATVPRISPEFSVVSSVGDIERFIRAHGLPVMVKPAALDKSMLIARADTVLDAIATYKEVLKRIGDLYEKKRRSIKPEIVIEQYMTGSKYSVEGFVDNNGVLHTPGTITDLWFGYDIGINDPMNYLSIVPSKKDDSTIVRILECTQDAVRALSMRSCPVHAELIVVEGQPRIIEVAARFGGYREELYERSMGVSLIEQYLRMYFGHPFSLRPSKRVSHAAVVKVYAHEEGRMSGIHGIERISDYRGYVSHKVKANKGEVVGPSRLGHKEVAEIFLHAPDTRSITEHADRIIKNIKVLTK